MNWTPAYPTEPGLYFVRENGGEPLLVLVEVEPGSHSLFYVLLPEDDNKYPLDFWKDALWSGPISAEH